MPLLQRTTSRSSGNNINRILDLGCGESKNSWVLQLDLSKHRYVGIDFIEGLEQQLNDNGPRAPLQCRYQTQDITEQRHLERYTNFDLVILKDVLQHMTDERYVRRHCNCVISALYV